jgi:ABC-type nitrate/sulfonate/bicarbonate transport system substrate-binding protein
MSLYTESPLLWGIHVPADSRLTSVADVCGARYAISRRGSGSHLMAVVHAQAQGWPVTGLDFVTIGNLDGAVEAFAAGTADVFFWEKFMTQPVVDAGRFRRVGEFAAPWPAFVVCVADAAGAEQGDALVRSLTLVLGEAGALRARPDAAAVIAARYGLAPSAVTQWLAATRWSARVGVAPDDVEPACAALSSLGVLTRTVAAIDCIAS